MGDFFKGWRRKAGLGTLALACLFAAGLMRSRAYSDFITCYRGNQRNHFLASHQNGIKWIASSRGQDMTSNPPRFSFLPYYRYRANSDVAMQPIFAGDGMIFEWRWQRRGFGFACGEATYGKYDISVCQVPYLSLILPLTLLSAWLILGKPRKANQQRSTSDLHTKAG